MSEDINGKTYSFDVCSHCNVTCCKDANPPLTRNRKKILGEYIGKHMFSPRTFFAGDEYSHPAAKEDGTCVFYNSESRKCCVHSVKPETCKAGPVTFDINSKTRKVEFYLKKEEICLFAQILQQNCELFTEHLKTAETEILQLISELEPDALRAILKIPEPQTFKIDEKDLSKEVLQKIGIE